MQPKSASNLLSLNWQALKLEKIGNHILHVQLDRAETQNSMNPQ